MFNFVTGGQKRRAQELLDNFINTEDSKFRDIRNVILEVDDYGEYLSKNIKQKDFEGYAEFLDHVCLAYKEKRLEKKQIRSRYNIILYRIWFSWFLYNMGLNGKYTNLEDTVKSLADETSCDIVLGEGIFSK